MSLLEKHKGIALSFLTAIFSGCAIFVNGFVVRAVGDPLVFTTLKNSLVVVLLFLWLLSFKKIYLFSKTTRKEKGYLFLIGVIGGAIPFYLFFTALSKMPAINASLIHKTLVFWVALLAIFFLREKLSFRQSGALVILFVSNLFIGGFQGFQFSEWELFALAATILWAVENIIAKKALRTLDSDLISFSRMGIGSLILLRAVGVSGKIPLLFSVTPAQFLMIFVTVILLTGYVLTWYKALSYAPATVVTTVLVFGSVVTNILTVVTHGF